MSLTLLFHPFVFNFSKLIDISSYIHIHIRDHVIEELLRKSRYVLWYQVKPVSNISTLSPLCDVYHNPFGIIIGIEGTKESYYFHHILDVKVTFAKLYRKSRQQFSRCARETGHGIGLYFSRNISSRIIRLKRLRVDLYNTTHRFTFFRYIYMYSRLD